MTISRISCPACKRRLALPARLLRRTFSAPCPSCQTMVTWVPPGSSIDTAARASLRRRPRWSVAA